MSDLCGQQLGNYYLHRLLGQGGFADVYLGEHIHLRTSAAIKVLQTRLGQAERQAFLAEARTVATLEHPHIIRILDFGIQENTPFIVMYYAANGSLRQHHPKGSILPLELVVTYVKQIASALQYAHTQNFMHRDVKPENMLFGHNHKILLSDFGIAQTAQNSQYQPTGPIIGTAAYMAPEQLQGKPSRASDQYALGILAYEWLSGTPPFQGNFMELYSQHLNIIPQSLYARRAEVSRDVDSVIQKALAKDPHYRFDTIQEFSLALEQASTLTERQSHSRTTWQVPQAAPVYTSLPTQTSEMPHQSAHYPATSSTPQRFPDTPSISKAYLNTSSGKHPLVQPPSPGELSQTHSSVLPPPPDPYSPVHVSGPPSPPAVANAYSPLPAWSAPVPPGAPRPQPQQLPLPVPQRSPKHTLRTLGIYTVGVLIIIALGINISAYFAPSTSNQPATFSSSSNSNTGNTTNATTAPSATPTPTPAVGTVLYQANWSQGTDGWNLPPQWKVSGNGTLGSDGSANGSGNNSFSAWAPAKVTGSNYAIEANIQFVRTITTYGVNTSEFGILLRGDGTNNAYEAGVHNQDPGDYQYHQGFTQGAMTLIAKIVSDNQSKRGFSDDATTLKYQAYQPDTKSHLFRIEAFGNTIRFLIDKTLMITTTDNTYLAGRIGLRAISADINVSSFKVIACSAKGC